LAGSTFLNSFYVRVGGGGLPASSVEILLMETSCAIRVSEQPVHHISFIVGIYIFQVALFICSLPLSHENSHVDLVEGTFS
jgi:hypothetical protein